MNTFVAFQILTCTPFITTLATPASQPSQKDRLTKLARYKTGTYLTADDIKTRVNIGKQLGGRVDVQLNDLNRKVYIVKTQANAQLKLDLIGLTDGDYALKN